MFLVTTSFFIYSASVYRQFKDMSVFLKELQDIVDKAKENNKENNNSVESFRRFSHFPMVN
ncbi:hypothetical protein EfmAA610_16680 [Enterococcus faecium]|nr:hypothetical protein EfmAA610_16680 [Enterococcus faecium]